MYIMSYPLEFCPWRIPTPSWLPYLFHQRLPLRQLDLQDSQALLQKNQLCLARLFLDRQLWGKKKKKVTVVHIAPEMSSTVNRYQEASNYEQESHSTKNFAFNRSAQALKEMNANA